MKRLIFTILFCLVCLCSHSQIWQLDFEGKKRDVRVLYYITDATYSEINFPYFLSFKAVMLSVGKDKIGISVNDPGYIDNVPYNVTITSFNKERKEIGALRCKFDNFEGHLFTTDKKNCEDFKFHLLTGNSFIINFYPLHNRDKMLNFMVDESLTQKLINVL